MAANSDLPAPPAGFKRPIVFFDMTIGGEKVGRIKMELFTDIVPKTAGNFLQICTGEGPDKKQYKGSKFHRVIKEFMIQGGDIMNGNGTGSYSIYGGKFNDENFTVKHDFFSLSMANSGPNTNGCQFFITTEKTSFLDGKHTVFGRVLDEDSQKIVKQIEHTETSKLKTPSHGADEPLKEVVIADSGLVEA